MFRNCTMVVLALFLVVGTTALARAGSLTPMEELGKLLFFDKISEPNSMACAECHGPRVGFTGPVPGFNLGGAVYPGAAPQRFGDRKPPANAYFTQSPIFHFDEEEGHFVGGAFWDGRATGEVLGSPAADQALGPFLNPVEQNNPSKRAVLEKVAAGQYTGLWEMVWGEPIAYETEAEIDMNYGRIGLAIAAYEGSSEVDQFSSKFDLYWADCVGAGNTPEECGLAEGAKSALDPNNILTDIEWDGLIEYGEYCAPCHVSHVPGPGGSAPLFTDFTYDNIGVPRNPENPFYDMDEVFLDDGSPINPLGDDFVDFGLGNFLRSRPEWQHLAAENDGKFKVPTLRNVDKRPGNGFPKAYMHNGVFKTLLQVVHFYNTRDVAEENWPPPEVDVNVNRELLEGVPLGDLQLAEEAEFAIVAFLRTLSDGFRGRRGSRTVSPISLNVTGPNPFNPSTFVTYSLPQPAVAKLYVFNVAGQKVATVVDGWKDAGEHRATFVADGLPSGVYFLQLVSGSEKVTTKAVLLK